jgi:hypothetical protein
MLSKPHPEEHVPNIKPKSEVICSHCLISCSGVVYTRSIWTKGIPNIECFLFIVLYKSKEYKYRYFKEHSIGFILCAIKVRVDIEEEAYIQDGDELREILDTRPCPDE